MARFRGRRPPGAAGWSSPVARQAHNLKVAGSNPAPATNTKSTAHNRPSESQGGLFASYMGAQGAWTSAAA